MIQTFRNISFRIWFSLVTGGLICFWFLPSIQGQIGLKWLILPAFSILLFIYLITGWIMNWTGKRMVERLTREAEIWERDSGVHEAEESFKKAVCVYESFIFSPGLKKKSSFDLTGKIARFYLARPLKDLDSEIFIVSYLKSHPEDKEVAENWLRQIAAKGLLGRGKRGLAARIGEAQPENSPIQIFLARLYLTDQRTDFEALQTYRRVLNKGGNQALSVVKELSAVFISEGRADEWALQVYLGALKAGADEENLIKGIAACIQWVPETERNAPLFKKARSLIAGINDDFLNHAKEAFNPPPPEPVIPEKISILLPVAKGLKRMIAFSGRSKKAGRDRLKNVKRSFLMIRGSKKARRIIFVSALAVLAIGIGFLVINTVGHLAKKPQQVVEKPITIKPVKTKDRFTIQVASYQNVERAKKMVSKLKAQGQDAFWVTAVGKNKKWFQVKLSHFPDKKSARAFGESLKKKGIIDDFFIDNYKKGQ